MWTHNFFFIVSMFSGNGAEAVTEAQVMPPLVTPNAISSAQPTKAPATSRRVKSAKKATPKSLSQPVAPALVAPQKSALAMAPEAPEATQPIALDMRTRVAFAPNAGTVIGKVQAFYNETKSFSAVFTQTVTNQTFNKLKPKVSKGKVYILKPGKMRWDYKNKSYKKVGDPKVSKSFISDGKHLWAVMHKNKQYYKEELNGSTLPVAVSFLMGTGDLRKEFDVAFDTAGKFGSKSDILLVLTPKQPSARYKKLWLVVDASNHSVKQSVVLNSKGDTNAIRFSASKVNAGKLKSRHFIFNAKANKDFRLVTPPKAAKKP